MYPWLTKEALRSEGGKTGRERSQANTGFQLESSLSLIPWSFEV